MVGFRSIVRSVKRIRWMVLLPAWVLLLTGSWAADAIKGEVLFQPWWPALTAYQVPLTIGSTVVFIISSIWLYMSGQKLFVRNLSRKLCEPHAVLILLVSPPAPHPHVATPLFPLRIVGAQASVELKGNALEADIEALNSVRWNWQQLLRALVPHDKKLQRVHLIGSPGEHGSFKWLDVCQGILQQYLAHVTVRKVQTSIDFKDFDALVRCMHDIIDAEGEQGIDEREIIIDVTGGIKTASIAGASITFNSQVTFQYVETEPPYEVYAYDVTYQTPTS